MSYDNEGEQPALLIDQAYDQAHFKFLRALVRVKEKSVTTKGTEKQDVTLSFEVGKTWFTIYHTLWGARISEMTPYLSRIGEKGQWMIVGISDFRASDTRPDKYGKAERVLFPHELATLFRVEPAPQEEEETTGFVPF